MRIYYTSISGADESRALYPGTSTRPGSAFGVSLLAAALEDYSAGGLLSKAEGLLLHRRVFTKTPEPHYSVSHSDTHVIVALSEAPVGIDTEPADRAVPQALIEKITTTEEREFLSFLEIWTLRESYFKLTGEGDLRSLHIYRHLGKIVTPREDVYCKQYKNVPGAVISVCSFKDDFPEGITEIPLEKLLKKEKPLQAYPKGFRLD